MSNQKRLRIYRVKSCSYYPWNYAMERRGERSVSEEKRRLLRRERCFVCVGQPPRTRGVAPEDLCAAPRQMPVDHGGVR